MFDMQYMLNTSLFPLLFYCLCRKLCCFLSVCAWTLSPTRRNHLRVQVMWLFLGTLFLISLIKSNKKHWTLSYWILIFISKANFFLKSNKISLIHFNLMLNVFWHVSWMPKNQIFRNWNFIGQKLYFSMNLLWFSSNIFWIPMICWERSIIGTWELVIFPLKRKVIHRLRPSEQGIIWCVT